jgi:WD40 repeat protein
MIPDDEIDEVMADMDPVSTDDDKEDEEPTILIISPEKFEKIFGKGLDGIADSLDAEDEDNTDICLQVPAIDFSDDEKLVALGWEDGHVEILDISEQSSTALEFRGHIAPIEHITLLSDGREPVIITNGGDRKVKAWTLTGTPLPTDIGELQGKVTAIGHVKTQRTILLGTIEGDIYFTKVFDVYSSDSNDE